MDYPEASAIPSENQAPSRSTPESLADDGIGTVNQLPRTVKRLQTLLHELERSSRCLQRASVSEDVVWHLHALKRAIHRALLTPVVNVWPCEDCGRPVAALRAFGGDAVSIVNAKEEPKPFSRGTEWQADIFTPHCCPEVKQ